MPDQFTGFRFTGLRRKPARAPGFAAASAALLSILFSAGCHSSMVAQPDSPASFRGDNTVADWPLKFVRHSFGAYCYDTIGCKVLYAGFPHGASSDDEVSPPASSRGPDYRKHWNAGHLALPNFPPPAVVTWRSKDGTAHEAEVDIGEIFKDRLILHDVPREDIREGVSIHNPGIVLEVNDRTINVYMKARIPTNSLRTPGNPNSDFRNDPVLAWSRTY